MQVKALVQLQGPTTPLAPEANQRPAELQRPTTSLLLHEPTERQVPGGSRHARHHPFINA
jgi:hypothetical protein